MTTLEPVEVDTASPAAQPALRVVLAHDYLTQRGGAERVVLELTRHFPDAPLLTTVYDADRTYPAFRDCDVRPSMISRFRVFRADPRRAFLLLAPLSSRITAPPGVLLASSSGWAHAFRSDGPKIVYCHNPARWLYQPDDYFAGLPKAVRRVLAVVLAPLRAWDRSAADSATLYLANSSSVARRIMSAYGIAARVVHPPASLRPDGPWEPIPGIKPGFFLTIGRSRGYKNALLVCEAVSRVAGARLVVVGGLPSGDWNDRLVGASDLSDAQMRWLYGNCRAVVAMSHEDFGLTPVEGFSFGKPSIALRKGGYLDTCVEGLTGTFVDSEQVQELARVLRAFDEQAYPAEAILAYAERFSPEAFVRAIRAAVDEVVH